MSDEDGWDNGSEPPAEEEQQQGTRRVRPLFRFRRNKKEPEQTRPPEESGEEEMEYGDVGDPSSQSRVRPVRVVKFVPSSDSETSEQDLEEVPFEATEEILEEDMDAAFAEVEEEPPFAEAEEVTEEETPLAEAEDVVEGEAPFAEAEVVAEWEAPFAEAEVVTEWEAPFAEAEEVVEEEAPLPEAELVIVEEAPLPEAELVPQEDPPIAVAEEVVDEPGLSEEMSYAVAEEVGEEPTFTEETAEEIPFAVAEQVDNVPEVPFAVIEEAEREDIGTETVSAEEEPEVGQDLEFRQEETPVRFQSRASSPAPGQPISQEPGHDASVPVVTPEGDEVSKPHYHKYLKPDEDILRQTPTRGRPSGFDQDLESEAGEIDFGIELIDPSERKKKKAPKKGPKEPGGPEKGPIGGHDADGEVSTRELGVDIGVDYSKRRKRRL